jgi:hypothetical protein
VGQPGDHRQNQVITSQTHSKSLTPFWASTAIPFGKPKEQAGFSPVVGCQCTAVEVAARLGLSETTVLEHYARGQLLAWREGRARVLRFPSWQFQADHVIAGLAEVLEVLNREKRLDDFGRIGFFLCTFGLLDGLRPLDCLRTNRKDKALLAAEGYVE